MFFDTTSFYIFYFYKTILLLTLIYKKTLMQDVQYPILIILNPNW